MNIVILGLSITSSWGNGHATTYRGLVRELSRRGHDVLFLERDQLWYAENRDLPQPPFCRLALYHSIRELHQFKDDVAAADCVILGSYVPDGIAAGQWVARTGRGVRAFYDIDTPVTLAKLETGKCDYLSPELIPRFDLYLSFSGGPTLELLERRYRSPRTKPFYCSADPEHYGPAKCEKQWDLGYLGTYSPDREPALQRLLIDPAIQLERRHFVVAGPQYPKDTPWPRNVRRIQHLAPAEHRAFYNAQRFALNITRRDMLRAGWAPSIRLFEAAACGTPIITDEWAGLESFFTPSQDILIARTAREMCEILCDLPDSERLLIGERARQRVLAHHTAAHRAEELETLISNFRQQGGETDSAASRSRPGVALRSDGRNHRPKWSYSPPAPPARGNSTEVTI